MGNTPPCKPHGQRGLYGHACFGEAYGDSYQRSQRVGRCEGLSTRQTTNRSFEGKPRVGAFGKFMRCGGPSEVAILRQRLPGIGTTKIHTLSCPEMGAGIDNPHTTTSSNQLVARPFRRCGIINRHQRQGHNPVPAESGREQLGGPRGCRFWDDHDDASRDHGVQLTF